MTEKLKEGIVVPKWMVTIFIVLITGLIAFNISLATTSQQTKLNKEAIGSKAEKTDVERIYNKLDRIEILLINHMIEEVKPPN